MKMKCRRIGTVKAIHAETKGRMAGPMTMRPSQKNLPVPCQRCVEGAVATRKGRIDGMEGRCTIEGGEGEEGEEGSGECHATTGRT